MKQLNIMVLTTLISLVSVTSYAAGMIGIKNLTNQAIMCQVDGYTEHSGGNKTSSFIVYPFNSLACSNGNPKNCPLMLGPSPHRFPARIDWISCNGRMIQHMGITPHAHNHMVNYTANGFHLCGYNNAPC